MRARSTGAIRESRLRQCWCFWWYLATAHRELAWLGAAMFAMLCVAARQARLPLTGALARAGVVLPFTAVFAGVSWLAGDPARARSAGDEELSLSAGSTPVGIYHTAAGVTPWIRNDGRPRFLLMVAQFLYRYLFVISEEAQHMRKAAMARGATVGGLAGNAARFRAAAGALAVLFARSYGRAEDIHRAMLARSFPGYFRPLVELHFHRGDILFLV